MASKPQGVEMATNYTARNLSAPLGAAPVNASSMNPMQNPGMGKRSMPLSSQRMAPFQRPAAMVPQTQRPVASVPMVSLPAQKPDLQAAKAMDTAAQNAAMQGGFLSVRGTPEQQGFEAAKAQAMRQPQGAMGQPVSGLTPMTEIRTGPAVASALDSHPMLVQLNQLGAQMSDMASKGQQGSPEFAQLQAQAQAKQQAMEADPSFQQMRAQQQALQQPAIQATSPQAPQNLALSLQRQLQATQPGQ